MSRRYEHAGADAPVELVRPQDNDPVWDDDGRDPAQRTPVIVIGNPWASAMAVHGEPAALARFALRLFAAAAPTCATVPAAAQYAAAQPDTREGIRMRAKDAAQKAAAEAAELYLAEAVLRLREHLPTTARIVFDAEGLYDGPSATLTRVYDGGGSVLWSQDGPDELEDDSSIRDMLSAAADLHHDYNGTGVEYTLDIPTLNVEPAPTRA